MKVVIKAATVEDRPNKPTIVLIVWDAGNGRKGISACSGRGACIMPERQRKGPCPVCIHGQNAETTLGELYDAVQKGRH